MSKLTLESLSERVAALEKVVAEIRQGQSNGFRQTNWRRALGMFAGNELMKQIDELGRQVREADRQEMGE